jgi:hypothetical protein
MNLTSAAVILVLSFDFIVQVAFSYKHVSKGKELQIFIQGCFFCVQW